jgi:hypothetical protein
VPAQCWSGCAWSAVLAGPPHGQNPAGVTGAGGGLVACGYSLLRGAGREQGAGPGFGGLLSGMLGVLRGGGCMKVYHTKEIRAMRKLPMMQAINHLQQKHTFVMLCWPCKVAFVGASLAAVYCSPAAAITHTHVCCYMCCPNTATAAVPQAAVASSNPCGFPTLQDCRLAEHVLAAASIHKHLCCHMCHATQHLLPCPRL